MAKPERPDPFTEGSIADIYRHFFGRLIIYKPPNMAIKDWLEVLFDIPNRDIGRWKVSRDFRMPGLYYEAASTPIQGIGYRAVKAGAELWVRRDARDLNIVDVEWLGGQGNKDQVFRLNESEWGWVSLHCKEADRKKK